MSDVRSGELPNAADIWRLARTIAARATYPISEYDTRAGVIAAYALERANGAGPRGAIESHIRQNYTTADGNAFREAIFAADVDQDTPPDPTPTAPQSPQLHWAHETEAPQPPIDWAVASIAAPGYVGIVAGPPGAGKTWLLHDLATHVALGMEWLGFEVPTARAVLFVDEESGPRRFRTRLSQSIRAHTTDHALPIAFTSLAGFNLREDGPASFQNAANGPASLPGLTLLIDLIDQVQPAVVIIDALADVFLGADENAVGEMQPVFHRLRQIAESRQTAIWLIHHANKLGGYRGSTAIAGAVDLMLMIERDVGNPKRMKVTATKARDIEPFYFEAELHFDPVSDTFDVVRVDATTKPTPVVLPRTQRLILDYLAQNGATPLTTLARCGEPGITVITARKAVADLAKAGRIVRIDQGGPGQPNAIYSLPVTQGHDDAVPI